MEKQKLDLINSSPGSHELKTVNMRLPFNSMEEDTTVLERIRQAVELTECV